MALRLLRPQEISGLNQPYWEDHWRTTNFHLTATLDHFQPHLSPLQRSLPEKRRQVRSDQRLAYEKAFVGMEGPLPHHFHSHLHENPLFPPPPQHTLPSQFDLDPSDPFQFNAQFDVQSPIPHPPPRNNALDPSLQQPRFHEIQPHLPQPAPSRRNVNTRPNGGQFGILTPHNPVPSNPQVHHEAFGRLQNEIDLRPSAEASGGASGGHFSNLKMIPEPPDLEAWRDRLFNVGEPIELTEDEYVARSESRTRSLHFLNNSCQVPNILSPR